MSTGSVLGVQEHEDFEEQIIQDTSTLNFLACQSDFTVIDVPRDGNCLFTAVGIQLPRLGIQLGEESLKKQLVTQYHPYTNDGTTLLRDFIAAPVLSANAYNADTDVADDEHEYITSIEGDSVRAKLHWKKYLQGLELNSWGDHVAVEGLANMLHVDIHTISTINPDMELIRTSHHTPVGVVHLGVIGQFHYQVLVEVES